MGDVLVLGLNLEEHVSMFKKLLVVLMLLGTPTAYAELVAFMPNQSGGRIVITNEVCTGADGKKYDNMYRLFTYNPTGTTVEGCFMFEGDTIRAYWPEAKQEARYELKNFKMYAK